MSPNLDGNIAEHFHSATAQLNAILQGKDLNVEVRDVFTANSVDVRVTDQITGKIQNNQLKYGQDANATIRLIERGNYNNQRIVVPTEQLPRFRLIFGQKAPKKPLLTVSKAGNP